MENGKNIHEQVTTIVAHARVLSTQDRGDYVRRACGADETLLSHVLQALGDALGEKAAQEQGFWDDVAAGEALARHRSKRSKGKCSAAIASCASSAPAAWATCTSRSAPMRSISSASR